MPRGGGRGKRSHKGQRRQFTQPEDLKAAAEKEERERQWRRQRGIDSDEEEKGEENKEKTEEGASAPASTTADKSSSEEEEESSDEDNPRAKGVEHLIAIENPNRAGGKRNKKVSELGDAPTTTNLSRREREELEKQEARRRYQQMHVAGKTEEAQADLARLAIIRKQREEAARKKEEERKAREASKDAAAKTKGKS
ncbi:uncharacterized protein LOC143282798 [Babylonia areolata]|uniref:uncharacterized protein LOC143282798 n=1 Tax=Babylonia areolata TaxID=304850 RepID=UPI003FD28AE5